MRTRKFKRSTLSILRIAAVAGCLSCSAFAQTPGPTPSPVPASPANSSLPQFFDKLIGRAGALIPMLQNEIEVRSAMAGEPFLVAGRARYHLRLRATVAGEPPARAPISSGGSGESPSFSR